MLKWSSLKIKYNVEIDRYCRKSLLFKCKSEHYQMINLFLQTKQLYNNFDQESSKND